MAIRGSKSAGEPMVNITVDRDMVYAPDGNRQTRRILHGPKFDKQKGKVFTTFVPLGGPEMSFSVARTEENWHGNK